MFPSQSFTQDCARDIVLIWRSKPTLLFHLIVERHLNDLKFRDCDWVDFVHLCIFIEFVCISS